MIKQDTTKIIVFSVLMLAAVAGYWGWQKLHTPPVISSPEKAAVRPDPDQVRFAPNAPQLSFLKIKAVEAFPEPLVEPLNGRITYDDNRTARVFSPLAGRIIKISGEIGMRVKKGDSLLVLDSPDFAVATSDSAKANADLLRKKEVYERAKSLYQIKGIARKDVEQAITDLQQAEAELRRAKARMKNLNASAPTPTNQFILRSPIAGTVSERQINAGSEIRPDATSSLFVITDPTHLWTQIDLPERHLDKVALGGLVSIEVDAYPGEVFEGKVTAISGALDPLTRRIQVRCQLDNTALKLKPEMFARITPISNTKSKLPRVPNTSIVTQGLFNFIFIEQSTGVLQRRRVTLSMQGSEYTYIKEGLQPGERIVTSGALLLNSELGAANDAVRN